MLRKKHQPRSPRSLASPVQLPTPSCSSGHALPRGSLPQLHSQICRWSPRILYDDMIVRRVNDSGCIRFKDQSLFISQSLSGWNLGLKSTQNQKTQLWFARLPLANIGPATLSFERIDLNPFDGRQNSFTASTANRRGQNENRGCLW